MDGVDQLNNVLIIGMTNRMDMIDEALLRPGRLEVHIEISLPDENGRHQILTIHTSKMRNNGVMANDVDLAELAALTKNFSGAEIGGLVKSATSFAFNRHVKVSRIAFFHRDVITEGRSERLQHLRTLSTSRSRGRTLCTRWTRCSRRLVSARKSCRRLCRMVSSTTRSGST